MTGADIKRWRENKGLSQRKVAKAAGISHTHLDRIERGFPIGDYLVIPLVEGLAGDGLAQPKRRTFRSTRALPSVPPIRTPTVYEFEVFNPPTPAGIRIMVRGGKPITYLRSEDREARQMIAAAFRERFGHVELLRGPVRLMLTAYLKCPARMSRKKRLEQPFVGTKPDADNILVAVQNALSGVAYEDDRQVAQTQVEKRYAVDQDGNDTQPRLRIRVEELTAAAVEAVSKRVRVSAPSPPAVVGNGAGNVVVKPRLEHVEVDQEVGADIGLEHVDDRQDDGHDDAQDVAEQSEPISGRVVPVPEPPAWHERLAADLVGGRLLQDRWNPDEESWGQYSARMRDLAAEQAPRPRRQAGLNRVWSPWLNAWVRQR